MRPTIPLLVALAALAALVTACGGGSDVAAPVTTVPTPAPVSNVSTVAVIGDVPYGSSATDTAQFQANPAFITGINNDADVSLVMHVGDIHSGKEYCTEAFDLSVFNQWKAFKSPLVYSPGDNEWSDCHKVAQGGGSFNATTSTIDYLHQSYAEGDPLANLSMVRSIFFPTPGKTLGAAMAVHSQATDYDTAHPSDSQYVENVWFEKSQVLFVTLNIPGGSNNDDDIWYGAPTMSNAQAQEKLVRSAANLRWLDTAFARAKSNGDVGVVIQIQADMWHGEKGAAHLTGYKQFVDKIVANAASFAKPVLLFNGDSHGYRSDNPLQAGAPCVAEVTAGTAAVACSVAGPAVQSYGTIDPYTNNQPGSNYNVPNFRRVVVHGSTTPLEYLKLTIDPAANAVNGTDAFGPFSWKRVKP
jgi:hypothetical protein